MPSDSIPPQADGATTKDNDKKVIENPKPANRGADLSRFLNSKFGLTLAGFVLTTFLGGLLTFTFSWVETMRQEKQHEFDVEREGKTATARENEDRAQSVKKLVNDAILPRLAYTELLIEAGNRDSTPKELDALWASYWAAYQNYFVFRSANEIPLDQSLSVASAELDKDKSLWAYLDQVIDPTFDRIHGCIIQAHDQAAASKEKPRLALQNIAGCIAGRMAFDKYWSSKPVGWGGPDPWKRIKICTETFIRQIDYSLKFRQELATEDDTAHGVPVSGTNACPAGYAGNYICRERQFNIELDQNMRSDCGPLRQL